MKNMNTLSLLSDFEETLKKIKKLKKDTIYTYSIFNVPSDKLRVYISRLADRGVIVKVSSGRFYKPNNMVAIKRSTKSFILNKKLFRNDLFWSVRDGFEIETDTLLKSYLQNYSQDDLMGLYSLFGYTRLIEESLKLYKSRKDLNYQKIREILMLFEQWRVNI
jgi:hypothetical protein